MVSAPRTGSTLLLQLITQQLKVGYVSNLMAAMPRYLTTTTRWTRAHCGKGRLTLRDAHYGFVPGLFSPNEAGGLCRRWFAGEPHEPTQHIRRAFAALTDLFDGPIVIKNTWNSLRIPVIHRALPEARWIHLRRDPVETGLSLLRARKDLCGTYDAWWGMRPPGMPEDMADDVYAQVLWQVKATDAIVETQLAACGRASAALALSFEDLRDEPLTTLERVSAGFEVPRRPLAGPLRLGPRNRGRPEDQKGERKMLESRVREVEEAVARMDSRPTGGAHG